MPASSSPGSSQRRPRSRGGRQREDLAIRFVNTAAWRLRSPVENRLPDAGSLLDWLAENGVMTRLAPSPGETGWGSWAWLHEAAITLRETIYQILKDGAEDRPPPPQLLARFNSFLTQAAPGAEIAPGPDGLAWKLRDAATAPAILSPIVISAAALMTGIRADRVKQCEDERGCGWLFVDESRTGNRRWCSMGDCGNRAKARRHYRRKKA